VQNRDSPFSRDILPFSVVSWGKVARSSLLSRFSSRFSDNLRKTSAPIVRLRAVRAHSVKMGPDKHCCRSSWPIRNVPASQLHSRSLPMRTKLGDQQYPAKSAPSHICERGATWRKRVSFLRKRGRNAPASTSPTPFTLLFNQTK